MHLLLDECVPRPLKRDIVGHVVEHVTDRGWAGKENGELLALMVREGFAGFVTVDQNLDGVSAERPSFGDRSDGLGG